LTFQSNNTGRGEKVRCFHYWPELYQQSLMCPLRSLAQLVYDPDVLIDDVAPMI